MKQSIDESDHKVTLLQSYTFRLYVVLLLLCFAVLFHMYVASAVLLFATGWYVEKVFGDAE